MRWGLLAVGFFGGVAFSVATIAPAHAAVIGPANGDFEAGSTGWAPADSGTLTVGAGQPVNGGAAAGHVQSVAAAPVTIRTQYWLTPAVATRQYTLSLAVRIPAATITSVTARLDLVTAAGAVLVSNAKVQAGPTVGYVTITTTSVTAPAGTEHALVVITGAATAAGARFSVDDLVITEVIPPPPPPPPPEPITVGEEAPPVPPAATPIARSSPIRLPSATPTPAPRALALANGTFDTGLAGWNVVQGRAWTDTWIPGAGPSLVLHTDSAGTVWAEQTLNGVQPGAWYGASALLATTGEVDSGWLRVAWHDGPDGSGRTLGNDDSLAIGITEGRELSAAPRYQVVGTRAIQAPLFASSVTVRFMLRASTTASLIIDNVVFGATADPSGAIAPAEARPAVMPTPAPEEPPAVMRGAFPRARVTSTPGARATGTPSTAAGASTPRAALPRPSATPRPAAAPTARAGATPTPALSTSGLRVEDVTTPGVADAQRAFRVTQLLPDPPNPGRDSEYEWVEISNLGAVAASVEGMTLRDNSGSVALPALVVPAGGSLVVASRLAEVPGVTAFRLPQTIGNGLGNSGDRLVLAAADGRQVDAFSYGEDTTYLAGPRIPVPGTGRAIERLFAPDGTFRDARIVEQPTPGRPRAAQPSTASTPPQVAQSATVEGVAGALGTWVVLLSLGAGLLGGAAAQRVASIRRGPRD